MFISYPYIMSIKLSGGSIHVASFHWPRKVICISLTLVGWDNIICFQGGISITTNIHFSMLPHTEHIYPLPTGDNPTTHSIRFKILGLMMVFTLVGRPINKLSSPYSFSILCLGRIRITIISIFIQKRKEWELQQSLVHKSLRSHWEVVSGP